MSSASDTTDTSHSSYSSAGGSSVGSDNTDARALSALQSGAEAEDAGDLYSANKGFQEAAFSTLFTLTKNRALDASRRLAAARIVVEFLQLFRVLFNSSLAWSIQRDLWIFRAVEWLLFRLIIVPKGYSTYVTAMYVIAGVIGLTLAATVWIAIALKGDDTGNAWLRRFVFLLQLVALLAYSVFPYAILDVLAFMLNCSWGGLAAGLPVRHLYFVEQSCLAMPHLAHMLFAGAMCIVFAGLTLIMSSALCDMNPMTRSWLVGPDAVTCFKLVGLKLALVTVSAMLDAFGGVQAVLMLLIVAGVWAYHVAELPYYAPLINAVWTGLWTGLLLVASILVGLQFSRAAHADDPIYAAKLTWSVLYGIFPAVALGAAATWARLWGLRRLTRKLRGAFADRREAAAAACSAADRQAREGGASLVSLMNDLRGVHRFKDVRQVSLACRAMRVWDEDGLPDAAATEFGEFVLKSGMARLPNSPTLLVMYANFLIEVPKDGQAARTQMQLAAKAAPGLLDAYSIFVAQQLAKLLKREGDGLDLLGYVEFQRNYRACVRAHKLTLMAQRQFWNGLLRDAVPFKDLQRIIDAMEATEQRATATYRRVLERYPSNGKLLKVYGRYLEFVRNDPSTAARFYDEALRQGTAESMLAMTAGQGGTEGLAAMGALNERADGLVIINAQGIVLMVNAACLGMFGYGKGELEGKNVSTLMPPPFSTHHDNFLKRYVDSGVPHIVGVPRAMVAIHKDRSMFPITLCATRLSGMGADMLFLGVLRRGAPVVGKDGRSIVRFWMTPNGTVMCADDSCGGCFGKSVADMTGASFSSLSTEPEAVVGFLAEAVRSDEASQQTTGEGVRLRTHLHHAYLPPVEVELTAELGGAVDKLSDCRTVIVHARMLSDDAAVMVLDHKSRLVYATDKLSALLGYPVSALVKMELSTLLPQPYCQMHGAWFKDLSRKPGPTSCRAGGVVHLLAANGTRVPVTLKLSARDDPGTGRPTHVVAVTRASEGQRLGQQRLLLTLNHAGTVLSTNDAASKTLFGFCPDEIVGRPLAALVDVFGLWRRQHGEDGSLLALLAEATVRSGSASPSALGAVPSTAPCNLSWRVGVHLPVPHDSDIVPHADQLAATSGGARDAAALAAGSAGGSLLRALQARHKLRAARMTLELLDVDEDALSSADAGAAASVPVLQVALHRADALSSVIELDKRLNVLRADDAAGLMFGLPSTALLRKSFARLVGLPSTTTNEQLLGSEHTATAKKGAMKGGTSSSSAARIGQLRALSTQHLADGAPLALEMQAISFHQAGKARLLVRLLLLDPASASLPALQALREDKSAAAGAASSLLVRQESEPPLPGAKHSDTDSGDDMPRQLLPTAADDGAPEPQPNADAYHSKRTSQWVREASRLPTLEVPPGHRDAADGVLRRRPGRSGVAVRRRDSEDEKAPLERRGLTWGADDAGESVAYVRARAGGTAAPRDAKLGGKSGAPDGSYKPDADGSERGSEASGTTALTAGAAKGETMSAAESASIGDGGSEAGGSMTSAAGADGHDEDLAIDARRAKRLKKLNRMVHSAAAQAASSRWRRHTLALLVVVLTAHVACFAVLTQQVTSRYDNSNAVAHMASGLDKFQAIALRSNFLQKCYLPVFANFSTCSAAMMRTHMAKLATNIDAAQLYHRQLFLGAGKLRSFSDPRLLEYWGYNELPEYIHLANATAADGTPLPGLTINASRTLWSMGNVIISAAQDVLFSAEAWGADMNKSWAWHYVVDNSAESLFQGYAWSLDIFVDYVWRDLTTLSVTLIILLVVEAVVVQLGCMAYEAVLVQATNVAHMRLFSVFLALPSATVRLMAARQLQVDDESRDEQDEDDLELADGGPGGAAMLTGGTATLTPGAAAAAAVEAADAADKGKTKSVRMAVEADDDADGNGSDNNHDDDHANGRRKRGGGARDGASVRRRGEGAMSGSLTVAARRKAATTKPKLTGLAALRKAAYKRLLGWLDPKLKLNGKRLVPSSAVLWRFMVPQLLWVAAVMAIFGVSYFSLQGLQGPLASLDTSAHVLYRMSRCRLMSNALAFSTSTSDNAFYRARLLEELARLRESYTTLMYGGQMQLRANVSFDPIAPAAAFAQSKIADIFFQTRECLRHDQSLCISDPANPLYDITHSGIDAMMQRYIDDMMAFAAAPDEFATPDHYAYDFAMKVGGTDLYESLNTASDMFVAWMISRFESVRQLHIIMLAISLACMGLFLLLLYRPYVATLRRDSRAVAGLLSLLPAEVDVEGHVKTIVLGMPRGAGTGGASASAGAGTASAAAPGSALPSGMAAGVMQMLPWGGGAGAGAGGMAGPWAGGAPAGWGGAPGGAAYGGPWTQQPGIGRAGSLV